MCRSKLRRSAHAVSDDPVKGGARLKRNVRNGSKADIRRGLRFGDKRAQVN